MIDLTKVENTDAILFALNDGVTVYSFWEPYDARGTGELVLQVVDKHNALNTGYRSAFYTANESNCVDASTWIKNYTRGDCEWDTCYEWFDRPW